MGVIGTAKNIRNAWKAETPRERLAAAVALGLSVVPFLFARGGASSASERTIVPLRFKPGWSPEQIAQARAKVATLNAAAKSGEIAKSTSVRGGTNAAAKWKAACGSVPHGCDLDHKIDLQLGGNNAIENLSPLDRSVNRSLGAQVYHGIRGLDDGAKVGGFTISW